MQALAKRLGEATGDYTAAGGSWFEVFDVPMTAHFLGGATIGSSPERGVVDGYHRVWGYPGHLGRRRLGGLGQPRRQPRRSPSPRRPSARCRCGPTSVTPTRARRRMRRMPSRRCRLDPAVPPGSRCGSSPRCRRGAARVAGRGRVGVRRPGVGGRCHDGWMSGSAGRGSRHPGRVVVQRARVAVARGVVAVRHGAGGRQRRGRRGRR